MGLATFLGHTGCVKWPKGPKMAILKNSLLTAFSNGNIFVKNFQHVFRHLGIMRVSYYFDIGKFFYTKIFHGPKNKFGKIIFWAYNFFLTLAFKSVNSNSSSFGKTVKRPINYFSQTSTQTAPPAKFYTLFLLFWANIAKPQIKNVIWAQKMVNKGP